MNNADTPFLKKYFGEYNCDVMPKLISKMSTRVLVDASMDNRDIVDMTMFNIFHPTAMGDIMDEI